jgi:hypothetical protein
MVRFLNAATLCFYRKGLTKTFHGYTNIWLVVAKQCLLMVKIIMRLKINSDNSIVVSNSAFFDRLYTNEKDPA